MRSKSDELKILTIDEGVEAIEQGKIIAYPTEGVYGLGVDAQNEATVDALYQLKRRDRRKGFIVIADRLERIEPWLIELSADERQMILDCNDYGYRNTWLIEVNKRAPRWIMGKFDTLAIRISNHPVAQGICECLKKPIVSTSANISNETTLLTYATLSEKFYGNIEGMVEGDLGFMDKPSTIIRLKNQIIIRE